jgi:hypothetical protein
MMKITTQQFQTMVSASEQKGPILEQELAINAEGKNFKTLSLTKD